MAKNEQNRTNGKYGRFVDEIGLLEKMVVSFVEHLPERGGNVGLRGEAGGGKTLAVHKLCDDEDAEVVALWAKYEYQGKPLKVPELLKMSCHAEHTYSDWVAQDIIVAGESRVREQIIPRWLAPCKPNTPRILLIDEANFMSPAVAGFLHPLADWQEGLWVPELSRFLERSPLHFLAMCLNPFEKSVYTGTNEMNAALGSRFEWLDVPYMSESAEVQWLKEQVPGIPHADVKRLVGFAQKTRLAYKMDLLRVPVTPRTLLDWMKKLKMGLSMDDLRAFATGMQLVDQSRQVLALWEGKDVKDVFEHSGEDEE